MKKNQLYLLGLSMVLSVFLVNCKSDDKESVYPHGVKILNGQGKAISAILGADYQVMMAVPTNLAELPEAPKYAFTSGDESVFKVSESGLITTVKKGDAYLYVDVMNYQMAQSVVTIKVGDAPVSSITIDPGSVNLSMLTPETFDLAPKIMVLPLYAAIKKVAYTSSNPEIASVTEEGVITAVLPGTATITVSATDGSDVSATCKVTVALGNIPVTSVSIEAASQTAALTIADEFNLGSKVTVLPAMATNKAVTYISSAPAVATVSAEGVVTAVSLGKSTITVTTVDGGKTDKCEVTVAAALIKVTSVTIDAADKTKKLAPGATFDLSSKVTVLPATATDKSLIYTSSAPSIASVSTEGVITALVDGSATITVSSTDGSQKTATCEVTVKTPVNTLLDRTGWVITASQDPLHTEALTNTPENLIDGLATTFLSLVKPGKSYGGVTNPAGGVMYFIVDLKVKKSFDYFEFTHRTSPTLEYLRPYKLTISGSNDNDTFTPILIDAPGQPAQANFTLTLPVQASYRYVKVEYTQWGTSGGSSCQMAELNIGVTD